MRKIQIPRKKQGLKRHLLLMYLVIHDLQWETSVSRQYDIPIKQLIKINQIINKTIYLGQELKISTKN